MRAHAACKKEEPGVHKKRTNYLRAVLVSEDAKHVIKR